ncbi:hypothetical protein DVS77_26595 [Mycolicibacterium moriokaense]|nr:hypothetical protein DVS77_26595 [Mycolicibacterium moriokaense]
MSKDRAMTTSTPQPEINSLYDRLNEARNKAWAEANDAHARTRRIAEETGSDPSASELIGLAAIEAVIQLTAQVHYLTVATREHTAALDRARDSSQQP